MVSRRDLAIGAAAAAASGALFLLGTGLQPQWWATWLAPLPVLLAAPRIAARPAAVAAFLGWLTGECGLWAYYTDRTALEQPVALVAGIFLVLAALFAAVVIGARALLRSGHPLAAAALVPAAWVSVEHALSGLTPNGLFWSTAYTQLDAPPLVQVAALTGPWGITFAVLALPAAVAAICAPGTPRRARLRLGVLAVAGSVLLAGYGGVRLATADPATGPAVGALALDQPVDPVPLTGPAGRALLARYAAGAARLADAGARTVVLPEKALAVDGTTLPLLAEALGGVAADRRVDVVIGVALEREGTAVNAALVFPADAGPPVEHRKHHLVPVLEDALVAGTELTVVDGSTGAQGVLICKDMDYPGLVRDYRAAGARLLLVPALDFDRDAWLHSRMAVLRGVETGLPVVRAGRAGAVTVSDAYGRVLAEDRTAGRAEASVVTAAPGPTAPTPYVLLGDWAAWLCGLVVVAVALVAARRWAGRGYQVTGSDRTA